MILFAEATARKVRAACLTARSRGRSCFTGVSFMELEVCFGLMSCNERRAKQAVLELCSDESARDIDESYVVASHCYSLKLSYSQLVASLLATSYLAAGPLRREQ